MSSTQSHPFFRTDLLIKKKNKRRRRINGEQKSVRIPTSLRMSFPRQDAPRYEPEVPGAGFKLDLQPSNISKSTLIAVHPSPSLLLSFLPSSLPPSLPPSLSLPPLLYLTHTHSRRSDTPIRAPCVEVVARISSTERRRRSREAKREAKPPATWAAREE